MTLEITYDIASPPADCGYKVKYRKNGASSYTEVNTSGSTVSAVISAPCCIEGTVQGDCCDGNLSTTVPFGINSYSQIFVDIQVSNTPSLHYKAVITTEYPNPYRTVIAGTFRTTGGGGQTLNYQITFPANSTEATVTIIGITPVSINETIGNIIINTLAPQFDNSGQIQLYDSELTPDYFQYIATSGYTWEGSPSVLPSFILTGLIALEVEDDVVTQANLLCTWIYDSVYEDGVNPYDAVTFEIYDEDNALIGELRAGTGIKGLNNISIFLQKADRELNTTNEFTMVTKWDDDSVIATLTFTLPEITL